GTELNKGPIVALNFEGTWSSNADNVAYTVTMTQSGNSVDGSYAGANGSQGRLQGNVSGRNLSFSWWQTDVKDGVGTFILSEDGGSFLGSYRSGSYVGSWTGTR